MASRLKALGLALIAVLALSAVAASGAWAQPEFTAEEYPATIVATSEQEIGSGEEYFEAANRRVECAAARFAGTSAEGSSTLAVSPDYTDHAQEGNCKAASLLTTTVTENGCKYVLHGLLQTEGGNHTVSVDVECAAETALEVHVGSSCTVTVPSQETTGTLTAVSDEGDIELSGTVGVHSVLHSSSALICAKAVGEHEVTTNYTINTPIVFAGEDDIGCGIPVDIAISGE